MRLTEKLGGNIELAIRQPGRKLSAIPIPKRHENNRFIHQQIFRIMKIKSLIVCAAPVIGRADRKRAVGGLLTPATSRKASSTPSKEHRAYLSSTASTMLNNFPGDCEDLRAGG